MTRLRLKPLFAMLSTALVCSTCAVSSVNAEVPDGGYQFFTNIFRVSHDMVGVDNNLWQCDLADVQSLIDERGWTTGQVVEALSYLVTNGVPSGTKKWTGPVRNKLIFDKSLSVLPIFGGTNALPAIEHVVDRHNPLVDSSAYEAYANVLGFGHDAFCNYNAKMVKPNSTNQFDMWTAYYSIRNVFDKAPRSTVETNRLVALLLRVADEYPDGWSAWGFDKNKCRLWPEYVISSNRLEYINSHFAGDMPSAASNYFSNARSELLALPPGTMQMLPTNQFYNVED